MEAHLLGDVVADQPEVDHVTAAAKVLFFLDEAIALAAGHRPCAECRHSRFLDFCNAWATAPSANGTQARPTADEIDGQLHAERLTPDRSKLSFTAPLDDLPDGALVTMSARSEQAYLVRGNELLAWSHGGYCERRRRPKGEEVRVLTPHSTRDDDPCWLRPRSPPVRIGLTQSTSTIRFCCASILRFAGHRTRLRELLADGSKDGHEVRSDGRDRHCAICDTHGNKRPKKAFVAYSFAEQIGHWPNCLNIPLRCVRIIGDDRRYLLWIRKIPAPVQGFFVCGQQAIRVLPNS